MSANITYVAIAHDGTVHTRSSKTMPYTHAIIVRSDGTSGPYSWHKSYAAAVKATGTVDKRLAGRPGARCYVVEVTGYPYSSPEAKRARNGETPEPVAEPEPVIERQTCRVCLEATEPAVTVDASDELGARRFHFCAEHAAAAEDYSTEPAPVVEAEPADEPTHTIAVVLRDAPAGTYVQGRSIDYRKSDRGDWATVSSTPDRYTSAQLATILGQPEQPAPAPAPAPAPRRSLRSIRVEDELWQAAQSKAKGNGDNVSEILRAALQAYIAQ